MNLVNYMLVAVLLILLINISGFNIKEGVTFTPYDNSKLLTRPWDEFCVQTPPSCQKDRSFLLVDREPPIGCWCRDKKSVLDNPSCTDIHYDPFIEFRR